MLLSLVVAARAVVASTSAERILINVNNCNLKSIKLQAEERKEERKKRVRRELSSEAFLH